MQADADGDLAAIHLNDRKLAGFTELNDEVANLVLASRIADGDEDWQAILHCDERLNYEHVINAITAVSGRITSDGKTLKLVKQIKFAP